MVFDGELRRITEFDENGVVTRTVNLSIPPPFVAVEVIGFLPDGRSIGLLWTFPVPATSGQILRRAAVLGMFDSAGAFEDRLATVVASELYVEPFGRGGEQQIEMPLGKRTGSVVLGNSVAISDGTDWAIKLIDVDTRAESSFSPPGRFALTELTPQYLAVIEAQRRGVDRDTRRFMERAGMPGYLPPYGWSGSRPVAPTGGRSRWVVVGSCCDRARRGCAMADFWRGGRNAHRGLRSARGTPRRWRWDCCHEAIQ